MTTKKDTYTRKGHIIFKEGNNHLECRNAYQAKALCSLLNLAKGYAPFAVDTNEESGEDEPFRVGDVVRVKGQSVEMTIIQYDFIQCECLWFGGDKTMYNSFIKTEVLKKRATPEAPGRCCNECGGEMFLSIGTCSACGKSG